MIKTIKCNICEGELLATGTMQCALIHVKYQAKQKLEYLRGEIKAERISYGEIAELQSLVKYIDKNDVELLQWAGVKENEDCVSMLELG